MTDRRQRIFTVAMLATLPLLWFLILAGWSSWLIPRLGRRLGGMAGASLAHVLPPFRLWHLAKRDDY